MKTCERRTRQVETPESPRKRPTRIGVQLEVETARERQISYSFPRESRDGSNRKVVNTARVERVARYYRPSVGKGFILGLVYNESINIFRNVGNLRTYRPREAEAAGAVRPTPRGS